MKKQRIRITTHTWLSAAVLCLTYLAALLLLQDRYTALLDSDMASELVLGKLLADEGRIVTPSWYYSTEVRVCNAQLLYAALFQITGSWRTVRLLSNALLYALLSGSTYALCRAAGCRRYALLTAGFPLLAMCYDYFIIMLMGCYYIPHIAISFVTAVLLFTAVRKSGKPRLLCVAGSSLIAVLAGMGGIRQLVITYVPLLLAVLLLLWQSIREDGAGRTLRSDLRPAFLTALFSFLGGAAGFLVNHTVLSSYCHVMDWGDMRFTALDATRLAQVVSDLLMTLGFTQGRVTVSSLLANAACVWLVLLLVLSIRKGLRRDTAFAYRFLTVFFLCILSLNTLLYLFTDMSYAARYHFPVMAYAFPLVMCYLHEADLGKAPAAARRVLVLLTAGMIFLRGGLMAADLRTRSRNDGLIPAAGQLLETDYRTGFATFWNGNVLTELTNGAAEMYVWGASGHDGTAFANTRHPEDLTAWLQETSHLTDLPEGKVFALYNKNEIPYCCWKEALREEDILFETDTYIAYGYPSCEEMLRLYDSVLPVE